MKNLNDMLRGMMVEMLSEITKEVVSSVATVGVIIYGIPNQKEDLCNLLAKEFGGWLMEKGPTTFSDSAEAKAFLSEMTVHLVRVADEYGKEHGTTPPRTERQCGR